MWHTAKAVLRENYSTEYIKKEEKSQISHIKSHLKNLEKEEQTKLKASMSNEIIKIRKRIETNGIYKRKQQRKSINKELGF